MKRIRPLASGSLSIVLAFALVSPAVQTVVAAQAVAAARTITVATQTSVEQVRYNDGKTDTRPPFKPLVAGESVFLRVTLLTEAAPLPAGVARLRLQFGNDLADADVRMVERDGVRRCVRVDMTVVSCVVDRVLRGDEASMLVKVTVPAGLDATDLWFRGTVVATGDLVVTARPSYARVKVVGRGAWSGTWHWYATWDTGAWDGDGIQLYQVRDDSKRVVCATWPWAGGGAAWGTVNERGIWQALWRDGFGEGTWKLELAGDNAFSGTQRVDVHGGGGFTADINGQRTSAAVPELDCAAILEQVK